MKNKELADESESRVKSTFDKIWVEEEKKKKRNVLYIIFELTLGRCSPTKFLFNIIKSELEKPVEKQQVLEPGCGKGKSALLLGKYGVKQTLLDISRYAIRIVGIKFDNARLENAKFVVASMFSLPFKNKTFDLIWNEGVLEHFSSKHQIKALMEFENALKDNGKIVIIIPNKESKVYTKCMSFAIKKGLWEFGYEKPERSLQHIIDKIPTLYIEREYSRGFINQFGFLRYYFYKNKYLLLAFQLLFSLLNFVFYPLNFFPGYYLICVIRKNDLLERGKV